MATVPGTRPAGRRTPPWSWYTRPGAESLIGHFQDYLRRELDLDAAATAPH